jgi:acetyl-CoA synthetase
MDNLNSSDQHWIDISKKIDWIKPWTELKKVSFVKPVEIKWYLNGQLNVSANCIDRYVEENPDRVAFVFEPDSPQEKSLQITYRDLLKHVSRLANVLKKHGVKKGDRVTIYMPMIPEATYAMLACARIGAIHSVVFGGFSSESLVDRINDCESSFVITANEGLRAGKVVALKKNVDEALKKTSFVKKVLVVSRTSSVWDKNAVDLDYTEEIKTASDQCEPEVMDAEDPLFILYTSGSTGKPKGVLHTTGGYLVYVNYTFREVFNYKNEDIYWCTADVGWVTGHSYIVYGPLSNGATTLIYEGVPSYPTPARFWEIIDKHQVNIFYTAPTAIRALMKEGESFLKTTRRSTLKVLGSVGEPINPEAWQWYYDHVGNQKCPVVDTWWQTETGGILISEVGTNINSKQKPSSATKPLKGIDAQVLNPEGKILFGACDGLLVIQNSWPGQMRTVYKNHSRFEETYFSSFPGFYFTGDGCRRDVDGDYWITGRVDDVINVSGHRMGTAEIESAIITHPAVAESAVVGFPHDLKGQGVFAYIILRNNFSQNEGLKNEINASVRKAIGPIASLDEVRFVSGLPKTRSGKIMRRILRKIAEKEFNNLGDISTLSDPSIVNEIIRLR